mmetsp:Transcript_8190/g.17715  ORF Transcript_8190/g.17715 Transcript_8190/m.17715 type:complete len:508 (+) Transcript_8190:1-1524(+)
MGKRKRSNPFGRAVDVGIRLCAGLDWIASGEDSKNASKDSVSAAVDDSAIQTLGEVERRLRIYWTRIDAEASVACTSNRILATNDQSSESALSLPWIEQAWQAGPTGNNSTNPSVCDSKLCRQALESMSKCHVFNPELSQPLWKAPCPYTRPGVSLLQMVTSGMKSALKWQQSDAYNENCFPMPRVGEVDDDTWMEVNSLEELEEEMKNLSSSSSSKTAKEGKQPRRTTRRSRRKVAQAKHEDNAEKSDEQEDKEKEEEMQSLNKMLHGFQSFVEGEGELEGAVTKHATQASVETTHKDEEDGPLSKTEPLPAPETLMSQEVNIDPRKFLNILHAMLSDNDANASHSNLPKVGDSEENPISTLDQDVSQYFFKEDLDDGSDDSTSGDGDVIHDEGAENSPIIGDPAGTDEEEDPWSLQNIMQAMDHELRTDQASDPSIKNLSVASVDMGGGGGESNDGDLAIISNLLSSIDAQGDGSGPATTILREMGICPPRQPLENENDDDDIQT